MITNHNSRPGGRKGWSQAVAAILALGKSIPQDKIDDLADVIDIDASVADGISRNYVDRVPSRQEIPVSPTTSASGAGAEQLPKWSSDPATQSGIAELYRRFSAMMEQFSELKKSQMDVVNCLQEFVKSNARFPDGEDEDSSADDDDEEVEKSKIGKALSGQGLTTGTIKEVLNILSSSRHGSSAYFAAYTFEEGERRCGGPGRA